MRHIQHHTALVLGVAAMVSVAFSAATTTPATAKTDNACGITYDARDKKLADGAAVVARGRLKLETEDNFTLVSLTNDSGSCELGLVSDPDETAAAVACGDGRSVTIIGRLTMDFILPMIDPATISCD